MRNWPSDARNEAEGAPTEVVGPAAAAAPPPSLSLPPITTSPSQIWESSGATSRAPAEAEAEEGDGTCCWLAAWLAACPHVVALAAAGGSCRGITHATCSSSCWLTAAAATVMTPADADFRPLRECFALPATFEGSAAEIAVSAGSAVGSSGTVSVGDGAFVHLAHSRGSWFRCVGF